MRGEVDGALAEARALGVSGFLLAGVETEGWAEEARIAARHPDVFVSVGVHPQIVCDASAWAMVDALPAALSGAVAIGEIGLDAFTPERRARLALQTEIFRAQLALARERDLPVILHILRAHEPALAVLTRDGLPRAGGVVHSYSGSRALLDRYLPLGLHLSLCGTITYRTAVKAKAVAAAVPRERLLIETDAPDQTPERHRPGPNRPAFLPEIAAAIALTRGESAAELGRFTEENTRRLFRLAPFRN